MDLYLLVERATSLTAVHFGRPRTFHAFGATNNTSSRQNIDCECKPKEWYRSASSAHASMSVGETSSSSVRALTALSVLPIDCNSAARRFRIDMLIGFCSRSKS